MEIFPTTFEDREMVSWNGNVLFFVFDAVDWLWSLRNWVDEILFKIC